MAGEQEIKAPPGFVLDEVKPPTGFVLDPIEGAAPAAAPGPGVTRDIEMPFPEPKGAASPAARLTQHPAMQAASEFAKGAWEQINPMNLVEAAAHPIDALHNVLSAQDLPRIRAKEEWQRGNYGDAINHFANYLIPLLGPQLDEAERKARHGQIARALGETVGFGVPAALGIRGAVMPEAAAIPRAAPDLFVPETEAETAAKVSRTAAPGTEIEAYRQARNLQAARAAYETASRDMKQTMQQQWIMQAMKEAGGDMAKFGELTEQAKGAIPFEDHQLFSGARNAVAHESLLSRAGNKAGSAMVPAELGALLHVVSPKVAPALAAVNLTSKIVGKLMGSAEGRSALSNLSKLPPGTPEFSAAWSAARALAAPKNKEKRITIRPNQTPVYAQGGALRNLERRTVSRRAVLDSLG